MAQDQLKVCAVPVDHVGVFWPCVSPWIKAAFDRNPEGTQSMATTRRRLTSGRYLLMLAADDEQVRCAAIVEKGAARGVATLGVVAAGGERSVTFQGPGQALWQGIMRLAREQGVENVRVCGRPGWVKWCSRQEGRRAKVKQIILDIGV